MAAKKTTRKAVHRKSTPAKPTKPVKATNPLGAPVFAEPSPTVDPTQYKVPHASDTQAYAEMDALIKASQFLPLSFPNGPTVEPVLTLATVLGAATVAQIQAAGQIVFHSAGDTGATRGPATENTVVGKLIADFSGEAPAAVPQFFYNLGDIVYSFGEHKYYYDQFYEAYRDYPAPIFAIPGNHDGIVLPPPAGTGAPSLNAFLANFSTPTFAHGTDAMGISRTTMVQPGVYFTLEAPFVRILGLYSNMLENPGVISSTKDPVTGIAKFPQLSDVQLAFLAAALTRIKTEKFAGAVIVAVHHPPYTFGTHSGSLVMLKEIDAICATTGVWPHAILSGHAHNYQRFTRSLGGRQIPFVVCGNGGHGLQPLSRTGTIRTPQDFPVFAQPERKDTVTFENYDQTAYGYLRILVDPAQLRIEYHPAADGAGTKTPNDSVTVDLASATLVHYLSPV
ncbi:MAG: metallophosphoesterase [Acidobacteriaceae bacterium]